MIVRSVVLACALTLVVGGCGADEPAAQRVAYTAAATASPPSPGTGEHVKVPVSTESCPDTAGGTLVGPVPDQWDVDSSGADYCAWSDGTATLTFEYADVEGDPWKWILSQSNEAQLEGTIEGFELIRQKQRAGGGPLWHYQYLVSRVDGAVYVDSLHLFRDGWHVTYEAESTDFNRFLERRLTKDLSVVG